MVLKHHVDLLVADSEPFSNLGTPVLDAYAVGNFAQPSALGLPHTLLQIANARLVIPDQGVDLLMTDADPIQGRHEAANLLRAPLLAQPVNDGGDHTGQTLRPPPGGTGPVIAKDLSLFRSVAPSGVVTAQLSTDRAVVDAKLSGDLSLAHADTPLGVNLVSLGLGQLSVFHALLHLSQ